MRSRQGAAVVASALTLLLATACSRSEPPAPHAAPAGAPATSTAEVVAPNPVEESGAARELGLRREFTGDLDAMQDRRLIRALVSYSKTYYFHDGPTQRGLSYEALKLFEGWLNDDLDTGRLEIHVMVIPTPRDRLLPDLIAGFGDIAAAGLTITPERLREVDFSAPFLSDVNEIVVTGPSGPRLESLDDLSGKKVYVRASSSYYESLRELDEQFVAQGRPPMELIPAEEYMEDEDLLHMVDGEILSTIVVDQHKAEFWDQVYDNLTLHPDLAVRRHGAIAWAFRKQSPRLEEAVNRFVARHKKGTLLGNILLKRYLGDAERLRNVFAEEDQARYDATVSLFQTYASQYGFDHLMLVAQGYQESGLDQSVVSSRGAIGIMQLLPSTARDKAVNIPDIHVADKNVHAGVRYMRWIRDTYFDDADMDEVNKTLFSFAAYNAGPRRVAGLRRKAAARGLDPDVWFRSVEIVAAEEIGRETVQYVSNIYKYYAAYRLYAEQERTRERITAGS